jgi:hypothetical protein
MLASAPQSRKKLMLWATVGAIIAAAAWRLIAAPLLSDHSYETHLLRNGIIRDIESIGRTVIGTIAHTCRRLECLIVSGPWP